MSSIVDHTSHLAANFEQVGKQLEEHSEQDQVKENQTQSQIEKSEVEDNEWVSIEIPSTPPMTRGASAGSACLETLDRKSEGHLDSRIAEGDILPATRMLARNSGGEAADEPLISPQPRKDAANLTQPSPSPDMQSAVSLGKWGSKLWKGLKKTLQPKVPSNLSDPATIMVKVQVGEPSHDQWRKVGMLIDSGSDTDVISEKILRDVLGMSMRPLEESQLQGFRLANCQNVDIKGYVDLTWYAKRGRRRHETRFFVPDMEDPNFELILGVNTSTKLGFLYFSIAALKAIHPKPSAHELQEESLRKRKHEEKQAENKTLLAEACKRLSSQAPTANKSANTDAKDASA